MKNTPEIESSTHSRRVESGLGRTASLAWIRAIAITSVSIGVVLFDGVLLAQTITPTRELFVQDGSTHDEFGWAVEMVGDLVAVGAPGPRQGWTDGRAVYLFDVNTGIQTARIDSPNPVPDRQFGFALASSGTTLAISDYDHPGGSGAGGAVHLYDLSTETLLHTLEASDPENGSAFGHSIAMDETYVVVGAPYKDDGGNLRVGAVYVFDVTTGGQLYKLEHSVRNTFGFDYFGWSVDIHDGMIVAGIGNSDEPTQPAGAAFVFDAATGAELHRLLPSDGVQYDEFGIHVALGDTFIAVLAINHIWGDPIHGNSGAIYLFDPGTGVEIREIAQHDPESPIPTRNVEVFDFDGSALAIGAPGDSLSYVVDASLASLDFELQLDPPNGFSGWGTAISIANRRVVSGAGFYDRAFVFVLPEDSDGDGLYDEWETEGIPYQDALGQTQRFVLPDADPNHKDLYLEIDAMAGLAFSNGALTLIESAFASAPVTNPDAIDGIELHVLRDETDLPLDSPWMLDAGGWVVGYDDLRDASFGTAFERSDPASEALLEAKAKAYRYCVVADESGPERVGGLGVLEGDETVLFLGDVSDDRVQASTLMHELGHNLGLDHGGPVGLPSSDFNGKPNHPSVMNYVLIDPFDWNEDFWTLDYAREDGLASIDENSIDESVGLGSPTGLYSGYLMPVGFSFTNGAGGVSRTYGYIPLNGTSIDVGRPNASMLRDGIVSMGGVIQDLNYALNPPAGIELPTAPSPGDVFVAYDEWANLKYALTGGSGAAAAAPTVPTEMTLPAKAWLNEALPEPALGTGLLLGIAMLGIGSRRRRELVRGRRRSMPTGNRRAAMPRSRATKGSPTGKAGAGNFMASNEAPPKFDFPQGRFRRSSHSE